MEYVLIYAKPVSFGTCPTRVLMVKKDRPEWQAGRYNLVGGKIEKEEVPEQAARRELWEEAGLVAAKETTPVVLGAIFGTWGTVYCVRIAVFDLAIHQSKQETEKVEWKEWSKLQGSPLLIPNLRIVIPLMMTGVSGWAVKDEGPSWKEQTHTIKITVSSDVDNNSVAIAGNRSRSGSIENAPRISGGAIYY